MLKYALFNYDNKESVRRFYNFYQKILLDNFMYEHLGSYQSFIEKLNENEFYRALIVYDIDELGGVIFEYEKDTNIGIIHYLATKDKNERLKEIIFDLAHDQVIEDAAKFNVENPSMIQKTPKNKKDKTIPDIIHDDEYFLKQLVVPSVKKRVYKKSI